MVFNFGATLGCAGSKKENVRTEPEQMRKTWKIWLLTLDPAVVSVLLRKWPTAEMNKFRHVLWGCWCRALWEMLTNEKRVLPPGQQFWSEHRLGKRPSSECYMLSIRSVLVPLNTHSAILQNPPLLLILLFSCQTITTPTKMLQLFLSKVLRCSFFAVSLIEILKGST